MQGLFNLSLMDARGVPEEVFAAARRERRIMELLRELRLPVKRRARSRNQVTQGFARFSFHKCFGSAPDVGYPFNLGGTGSAYFGLFYLDNRDADPDYQELWTGNNYPYDQGYQTGVTKPGTSKTYKRFIEDDDDAPDIFVDPTGRERIYFRSRFLFTPVEGVANDIRSMTVTFREDADTQSYTDSGTSCRTRLRDAKGRKVTMNKTITDVLLVEYEFTVTAI